MGKQAWTAPVLEVHLLEKDALPSDRSPSHLRLEFRAFLRPEKTFPSLTALRDQIAADIATAQLDLEV
jgi:FAD synthase